MDHGLLTPALPLMASPAALAVPLAALGLVFGSFVTALSYRLPRGQSIAAGRSRCPACGHTLGPADLVPVFSWAAHRGACRHCGARVSARYPAIELLSALLFIAAGFAAGDVAHLGLLLAMTPILIALAVIDLEHARLPNSLLTALAAAALVWRAAGDQDFVTAALMGLGVAAAAMALDWVYRRATGRPGLGMGDAKLLAVAGLALPVGSFLLFGALAGLLGVVSGALAYTRTRSWESSFGPALATAFWITLGFGDKLMNQLLMVRLS